MSSSIDDVHMDIDLADSEKPEEELESLLEKSANIHAVDTLNETKIPKKTSRTLSTNKEKVQMKNNKSNSHEKREQAETYADMKAQLRREREDERLQELKGKADDATAEYNHQKTKIESRQTRENLKLKAKESRIQKKKDLDNLHEKERSRRLQQQIDALQKKLKNDADEKIKSQSKNI
ncbi:hypothetical protein FO519_009141 [Halicephalobus sp. NKZ332]|nr:hypothetical protein FO519_009141 [Halicephalobus sp. NKZ332]